MNPTKSFLERGGEIRAGRYEPTSFYCNGCVHDDDTGCMMSDCIHHPDWEKNAASVMTNTFRDRFMYRKKNPFKKKEVEDLW